MEIQEKNYHILQQEATKLGAALFGVANLAEHPVATYELDREILKRLPYGISIGVRLADGVIEELTDHPTLFYLHHYRQVNYQLDRIALAIAAMIEKVGGKGLAIAASQVVDWEGQRGHISHKGVAQRAGLGWIGRNNLLCNPIHGARVRLVTILTDLPLRTDGILSASCGSCRKCVAVCPAGAIKDELEGFDHRACLEKLKEFRSRYNIGQYICGLCVKACGPR